jgi:hypothetical protein
MNHDVKWMNYQFTPAQIAQAANTLERAMARLLLRGWSSADYWGLDAVGAIRWAAGASNWHGTMNAPEVIAETILTHYLRINVYAWEESVLGGSDGLRESYDKLQSTFTDLITWLRSDTFSGGSNGTADSEAAAATEESPYVGAH